MRKSITSKMEFDEKLFSATMSAMILLNNDFKVFRVSPDVFQDVKFYNRILLTDKFDAELQLVEWIKNGDAFDLSYKILNIGEVI